MKSNFNKLVTMILIMVALLISNPVEKVNAGDANQDWQTAQELVYGNWGPYATDWVKYHFNESSVRIIDVEYVDPYGDSRIQVRLIKNGVEEVYAKCFFNIHYNPNSDKYELNIEKVRHNSKVFESGVTDKKFVKVYWDNK